MAEVKRNKTHKNKMGPNLNCCRSLIENDPEMDINNEATSKPKTQDLGKQKYI